MHPTDDDSQLMSKFSSDGEESFIGRPQASRDPDVNVQDVGRWGHVVNETDAEDGSGTGYSRRPPSRLRPSALFSRLTSKLRTATPPNSPSPTSSSFNHLSPTRPYITPEVEYFPSKEPREAPLRERGLLTPQDRSVQEREHDRYLGSIAQGGIFEQHRGEKMTTESKKIQEQWQAKNQGATNGDMKKGNMPVRPPRPKGAFYPAVLATPQFGKLTSTPDIAKPMERSEGAILQPRLPPLAAPAALLPSQEPTAPFTAPPVNDESRHLPSSATSLLTPHAQKWPRPPPNRSLPPIPTHISPQPASPISPIIMSSDSSVSSGQQSFVTVSPFTPMSQGFTRDTAPTSASHSRRGSGDLFKREGISKGVGAPAEIAAYSIRAPNIDRAPLTMNSRARSGLSNQVDTTVAEKREVVRSIFPVMRPKSRGDGESKRVQVPRRPRTADPPRPKTSETINPSPGRSQRRKSFVGQSLQNLRKSVTDTITKGRPRSSALKVTPSASLAPWKYDVSQLPPSPTLPSPPPATTGSHP